MPSPKDRARLEHIIQAASDAVSFAQGRKPSDLETDRMFARALVNCVEVIGEAAVNISDGIKTAYPEVQWRQIIAMRNRLVHGYFAIRNERLWDTVQTDLPELLEQARKILSGLGPESE